MTNDTTRIVQLKVELANTDPPVWRRVKVPAVYPLRRVHDVIQAVFDWLDYHLHQFEIGGSIYGQTEIAPEDFGPGRQYDDRNIRLRALLDRGVERFIYRYDFGDDWEHIVTIEKVMDPAPGVEYPVCVDGARQAPPEDCGGPFGFAEFLDAMRDKKHEAHRHYMDWYGAAFDPDDMQLDDVEARLRRIRARARQGRRKDK